MKLKLAERRQLGARIHDGPSNSDLTGRIIEWNPNKGFGFLHTGDRRVFLHIRDFSERHKRPEIGDTIRFNLGRDEQGRPCAQDAVHLNDGGRITPVHILILGALMTLPSLALFRAGAEPSWIAGYFLGMGAITYWSYAVDKTRARAQEWRIPERQLHLLELLGGWAGAWLAQKQLHHKCSKGSYQFTFWLILLAWQVASYDSLQDWTLIHRIQNLITRFS